MLAAFLGRSTNCHNREAARWIVLSATIAGSVVSAWALQSADAVTVNDPRPLSKAIEIIETRCHCVVSYEDPQWQLDQVLDVSGLVQRTADAPRTRVPNGRPFTFTLDRSASLSTPDELHATLRRLLSTFERSGGLGSFQVIKGAEAFHVTPKTGSVLDAMINVPKGTRSIAEMISMILKTAGQRTGTVIELATGPLGLLKKPVDMESQNQLARDVLVRALNSTGERLSWQLFYDFGMKKYYLNLHSVK